MFKYLNKTNKINVNYTLSSLKNRPTGCKTANDEILKTLKAENEIKSKECSKILLRNNIKLLIGRRLIKLRF